MVNRSFPMYIYIHIYTHIYIHIICMYNYIYIHIIYTSISWWTHYFLEHFPAPTIPSPSRCPQRLHRLPGVPRCSWPRPAAAVAGARRSPGPSAGRPPPWGPPGRCRCRGSPGLGRVEPEVFANKRGIIYGIIWNSMDLYEIIWNYV